MSRSADDFEPEPAVLRCGRCGKAVDWDEAQLQVVCSCRPHIPRAAARPGSRSHRRRTAPWFAISSVATSDAPGSSCWRGAERRRHARARGDDAPGCVGALAYRLFGDGLHIVALATDAPWQRSGVGGHLVAEAELLASRLWLTRVIVTTTNDNLPALYLYQRRGYRMTALIAAGILRAHPRRAERFWGHSGPRRSASREAALLVCVYFVATACASITPEPAAICS